MPRGIQDGADYIYINDVVVGAIDDLADHGLMGRTEKEIGVSRGYLSRLRVAHLRGDKTPRMRRAAWEKLCTHLGLDPSKAYIPVLKPPINIPEPQRPYIEVSKIGSDNRLGGEVILVSPPPKYMMAVLGTFDGCYWEQEAATCCEAWRIALGCTVEDMTPNGLPWGNKED